MSTFGFTHSETEMAAEGLTADSPGWDDHGSKAWPCHAVEDLSLLGWLQGRLLLFLTEDWPVTPVH